MDTIGKSWLGANLQIVKTAPHAIWGSCVFYGGGMDIHFDGYFMNVTLDYLRGLDKKNKIFMAIEAGLDIGLISNNVTIGSTMYPEAMSGGVGFHLAGGMDVELAKFLGMNARLGYRHLKTSDAHKDASSTTGYKSFYVNGTDGETVKVDWSGVYFTVGLYLIIN